MIRERTTTTTTQVRSTDVISRLPTARNDVARLRLFLFRSVAEYGIAVRRQKSRIGRLGDRVEFIRFGQRKRRQLRGPLSVTRTRDTLVETDDDRSVVANDAVPR